MSEEYSTKGWIIYIVKFSSHIISSYNRSFGCNGFNEYMSLSGFWILRSFARECYEKNVPENKWKALLPLNSRFLIKKYLLYYLRILIA